MSKHGYYSTTITDEIFKEHELVPGTSQIYEIDLAYGEIQSLTDQELLSQGAYFSKVKGQVTNHYKICAMAPLQVDKTTTMRRQSFFESNQFKTAYATHGLFPYRGKFHPQLIKAIMNIIGIKPGQTVLDSMTGSGTINIEASIIGVNSIGIDMSPFCVLMTRSKVNALDADIDKLKKYTENPIDIFNNFEKDKIPTKLEDFDKEANEIINNGLVSEKDYRDLLLLSYLDSKGYGERRKKKTAFQLFPVVLERYIQAITNFYKVKDELGLKLGKADIYQGDARNLNIDNETIDGVITSPPYSFAIDYIENDESHLEYLGINSDELRKDMIGLYGKTRTDKVANYFKDMKKVMDEFYRVLKPGKCCVIVIGSNEKQTGGIRHEEEIIKYGQEIGFNLFKLMTRPITGIRNTMRDEYVLFFEKN